MAGEHGYIGSLQKMAARMDEAELSYEGIEDGRGWGQFLDGPREHPQVGPYGVCSGVIVRSCAGRTHEGPEHRAVDVLSEMFTRYQGGEPETRRLFAQNLRLAFLCLALRLAGKTVEAVRVSAEDELLSRRLANGMWGDWWIDRDNHDPTPRPFVAAIGTLCLLVFSERRGRSAEIREQLRSSADALAASLEETPDWSPLSRAGALAALEVATYKRVSLIRKHSKSLIIAPAAVTSDLGVYFYDYQYSDAQGNLQYGRDYFIVPIELLIAIVGLLPRASATSRLHGIEVVDNVAVVVASNNGVYRSSSQQRASTKNQAWAAIALKLATQEIDAATIGQRAVWSLVKPRYNTHVDRWFPVVAALVVTALSALGKDAGLLQSAICAVASLVVGGLYAPSIFRRLLRGRL